MGERDGLMTYAELGLSKNRKSTPRKFGSVLSVTSVVHSFVSVTAGNVKDLPEFVGNADTTHEDKKNHQCEKDACHVTHAKMNQLNGRKRNFHKIPQWVLK